MRSPLELPEGVGWAVEDPRTFRGPWLEAEEKVVARAVEKRRREFGCGRHLARGVLAELGIRAGPLLPRADRRPPWPEAAVGSITHCEDLCLVVAALRTDWTTVGVDVEPDVPLSPDTMSVVVGAAERARFEGPPSPLDWGKATFVAKEAYYKAQYEMTQRLLEFSDVEVRFSAPPVEGATVHFACEGSKSPPLEGTLVRREGHVWAFSGRRRT